MVLLSLAVHVFLVLLLQVVLIGGAGVPGPTNVTLTNDNPSIKFSPDWTTTNAYGTEVAVADTVGSEMQVDNIVNATAIYFVGLKSSVGSTFAACLDCQPIRSPTRQFQIVDAYEPASPDAETPSPVVLFSMTGLDPTVAHSLRVVNLWDPDFGDFSQIAFDKLVVTSLNPNGDVIGNTSTPSPGGILNPPLNAPSNDSASPISVSPPSTSNTQAGDPLQTVNSPASTPQAGNPAQTANAPASTPQIGGPFQTINPPASDTQVGGPIQTVNAPASNTIPVQTSNTVQYPNTSALPVSQSLPPVASSTAQYPNTSVLPVSGPTQTPSQTSNTAQYPNTSAIPDPKAATTLSLAATTPTAPPRSATVNQVNNNSPTTVTVAAPTIASPPTETIVVPSVVGNAGSSATPSEALSKALLAMMVLLLIVFLSCLVFGIFTLYMQTRARRRNRANIEDGMSSLGAHITPYVIASPTSANRDSYNRHSYTAAYHGGDPHIPSPITIPHPPYDRSSMSTSPSVRSLTPMAEVFHNPSSSQVHLSPFRDSSTELATSAWVARSPRFRNAE